MRHYLVIGIAAIALAACDIPPPCEPQLTMEQFLQIESGMTFEELEALLPGEGIKESQFGWVWRDSCDPGDRWIDATINQKGVVVGFRQSGLEE